MENPMDPVEAKRIILDKVKDLPTLPDVIHKVLALMQDDSTAAEKLSNLISYDHAISSRLLKVANSAYYGMRRNVATVQHAIVILGYREITSLVLGIGVFDIMKGDKSEAALEKEKFWMHSMGSAIAGRIICRRTGGANPETAYTASLLHDIGKLVLDIIFPQEYVNIIKKVRKNGADVFEVEEEVFGFCHADVGGWLCDRWKLPQILSSPISLHHHVEKADENYVQLTSIIHLADNLSQRVFIENGNDKALPIIQPHALNHVNLEQDDLEKIIDELKEEQDKVISFLNAIQ